ncbi:MAG: ATP-binding cassette domain-containing protein, partial [SAR202 cluster bacterium]|nr:ATP-binding cassette domain-containing protein [SAR202 cluster bacterium]
RIGFVFQQYHLLPYLSVLDNVLLPCLARAISDARRRSEELIKHLGLTDRKHHTPAELSSGECQRTALARAILARPGLLLADEPTGNLDEQNAATVLDHMAEFARAGGAVLLVTHDAQAAGYAQRTLRLIDGNLSEA